ncbi:voltage-dependent calcium channel subunit alpha-2/delta-3-like [Patiria miniata]|uniref:VWFA domain-containing protein n=1 Tax=Patiria miniata TaxID=46514 RepID=A0A914A0J2_PATMI|nr:voltage-dependent calcium channel subunit alpha-2/delta-3-like [Patiria miniata]
MVAMGTAVFLCHCLVATVLMLPCTETLNYNEIDHDEGPGYSYASEDGGGRLVGHVQNWATLIQNYILQLASDGLKTEYTQSYYDNADYIYQKKNASNIVAHVKKLLDSYFARKEDVAKRIANAVKRLHDDNLGKIIYRSLPEMPKEIYKDSDIPGRLPKLEYNAYFRQAVSTESSTVKISDEVPRESQDTVNAVFYTKDLDDVFISNFNNDSSLRWQYFGSVEGVLRKFPGREWSRNFAGFYNDYDPRVRPWYITGTSDPKDVVIILDCSTSMEGKKFDIAISLVRIILDTLTKQDYVNVICARASHWDEVGDWYPFNTTVLSCKDDRLVPATTAHRKDLKEKTGELKPKGTSELKRGFEKAFELLSGKSRTGCQALIILVTDGKDTDGETVRCGPGYYTRSGYVPGPICKYDWSKVWNRVKELNAVAQPQARIFSYGTIDAGEIFPGHLACKNRGYFKKLTDGENLIGKMRDYFNFLSSNSQQTKDFEGKWTAPYIDAFGLKQMVTHAIPVISDRTEKLLGVVGVDCTLEEIENLIVNEQWGSVYAFLIDNYGGTIFHPLLKPSSDLVEDPILVPIRQLEQPEGQPEEFSAVIDAMLKGETGYREIKNAQRGVPKGSFSDGVKRQVMPATYFYTHLDKTDYSFAFSLAKTDEVFRQAEEPKDRSHLQPTSYFNLLKEYNSTLGRQELPGEFEKMQVFYNEPKYPDLRVSYLYSSFFLAPRCYCDPNVYLVDDDLATKTVAAHKFINGWDPDVECPKDDKKNKFRKGIRADVLITSQIEKIWRSRNKKMLQDVKWTYIGCRSGVFRTYPGHRSKRYYDPTKRPWYHRVITNSDKTSISTAYMDSAGVGKIISVSQAVFEGMPTIDEEQCDLVDGKKPGGCKCSTDADCVSARCYKSKAVNLTDTTRCASVKVEAVTSLDILYNDFHLNVFEIMRDIDMPLSCQFTYPCPDGEPGCSTRCYLFDNSANIVIDPQFISISDLDTAKYNRVSLGKKEGEIMRELIYKHRFFFRKETIDFQGSCSLSSSSPRVNLNGIAKTPGELDDYYKNKGPIPNFSNKFGCIQDVVGYQANSSVLEPSGMIIGNISGSCKSGFYYVKALPKTNLFLLVVENWRNYRESMYFNFNCRITNRVSATGAFRIINGTCAHEDDTASLASLNRCPVSTNYEITNCTYNTGTPTNTQLAWSLLLVGLGSIHLVAL